MATNEILPFCNVDTGTNLLTQVEYDADGQRIIGNQPGPPPARSKLVNKVLKQTSIISSGFGEFLSDYQNDNIVDTLSENQISQIIFNAINNATQSALFPSATLRRKAVPVVDPGWAYCDGSNYDMVGSGANTETQRLGNTFQSQNLVDIYGRGTESYTTIATPTAVQFTCVSVGVCNTPSSGTSGFNIIVNLPGSANIKQTCSVFPFAGNSINPGVYFELFAPSGRSAVFWFEVDGLGTAPSFPNALLQKVAILSTDSSTEVGQKINDSSFLQYRVPDYRGQFFRNLDDGAGVDPDSTARTDVNGNIVGDVLGSIQEDALQDHQHTPLQGNFIQNGSPVNVTATSGNEQFSFNSSTSGIDQSGLNNGPAGRVSTETRSKNIYVYTLIKF